MPRPTVTASGVMTCPSARPTTIRLPWFDAKLGACVAVERDPGQYHFVVYRLRARAYVPEVFRHGRQRQGVVTIQGETTDRLAAFFTDHPDLVARLDADDFERVMRETHEGFLHVLG